MSEKEQVWRGHLARAAEFSGSVSAFCRSEGLSTTAHSGESTVSSEHSCPSSGRNSSGFKGPEPRRISK
jgi:hypothetical protein